MKKIIIFVMCFALIISLPLCVYANDNEGKDENINAKAVVLMDIDSKQVLYEQNKDDQLSPASVTKIMSLLLILEAIEDEKITLLDEVTASKTAVSMGGSQIWLEVGEKMTVDELLKAVIIASANDACTALGEYVAGSSIAFVKLMNDKAQELGLAHTNFENCTGLDDTVKAHYSSAYDLAVIASEVMKYDLVKQYSTVWMDSLRGGETELNNTNKLVNSYDGITGLKTGTTSNAGFCIAATASREDMNLVAVVLGSDTSEHRFNTASYLLDKGFSEYKSFTPEIDNSMISDVTVNNGEVKTIVPIYPNVNKILLENNETQISYNYDIVKNISAPVKAGDLLGKIEIIVDSNVVSQIDLVCPEDIAKITFKSIFIKMISRI